MLKMTKWTTFAVCVVVLIAINGCAGKKKPDGMPKLVPCSVKIVQAGNPLAGATVSFYSDSSQWSVGGTTDENGVAKMYTHGEYPGSPEGSYKVTVEKCVVDAPDVDLSTMSPSVAPTGLTAKNYVDLKFKDRETTELKIDVKGKTSAEFDVGAAVEEEVKRI